MDPKQWSNKTPYPPLATLYAASWMRQHGYDVSLFDVALRSNPYELNEMLKIEQPDYLVIYDDGFNFLTKMCLTRMREAAFEMIKTAKKHHIPVIVYSSDSTDHSEKYLSQGADFIIYGEGEITLLELIQHLENNTNNQPQHIKGIRFLKDGKLQITPSRPVVKNLDIFPFPAWDLVDVDAYKNIWKKSRFPFTLNISTTRGCPFHCNWCAKPIYGQRYNAHSPEYIARLIHSLQKKYKVSRFWMTDDIFGLKPGWIQAFNKEIQKRNLKISYFIQSRADLLLKDDTIEALAESGAEEVWIGAESGSQKILDAMDKGITVEQIKEATYRLRNKGIKVAYFIQYGYLGETKEDINKTLEMIRVNKPDHIGVSVSYPLPGTKFYEIVKEQMKEKTNWEHSDDLAMMFRGTFNTNFYRRLQRYTHRELKKIQALEQLKNLKITDKRAVLLLPYYLFSTWLDKIVLSRMENTNA